MRSEGRFSKYSIYFFMGFVLFSACETEEKKVDPKVSLPPTYSFSRANSSSISFTGQTTRIKMASELVNAMKDFQGSTEASLIEMYRNQSEDGGDVSPFTEESLNQSTKNIKSKVASSRDLFSSNTVESHLIQNQIETWLAAQTNEVFPNQEVLASPGIAGQISDGSSTRYVSAKGLEYNQIVCKSLIGSLMLDQIVNNYLSVAVLDDGNNRSQNDSETLAEGKNYTTMEHKWDESYGYIFGVSQNAESPLATLGDDDFLNKYLGRVEDDPDFSGIAQTVHDAFKLGRAAIVSKNYIVRDEQAEILRSNLTKIIAIRAVHYLQSGKNAIPEDSINSKYGAAFHDLSEGLGFVYSLRFTRMPNSSQSYFSRDEVDGFLSSILEGNGLWDVNTETLDDVSASIADKFNFTIAQTID